MIIGRALIRSHDIDIHGSDITIHWEDANIPWQEIDSTTNNVFVLSQYNASFRSETKIMKRILNDSYPKADLKTIAKAPLLLIFKKETSYTQ